MVTMPASAALRFAKDVRQIKKAADVLAALQNAIPANDIRVSLPLGICRKVILITQPSFRARRCSFMTACR
jgi:hypothetical protein